MTGLSSTTALGSVEALPVTLQTLAGQTATSSVNSFSLIKTDLTFTLDGQTATGTVNADKLILKYYGKLDPKTSSGYTGKTPKTSASGYSTKTPKNTTGYTTLTP